jgi:hypothetical protein
VDLRGRQSQRNEFSEEQFPDFSYLVAIYVAFGLSLFLWTLTARSRAELATAVASLFVVAGLTVVAFLSSAVSVIAAVLVLLLAFALRRRAEAVGAH